MTNVSPIVKFAPDGGLQVTITLTPELSEAVGYTQTATACGWPRMVGSIRLAGHISNFGVSSSKMFINQTISNGLS